MTSLLLVCASFVSTDPALAQTSAELEARLLPLITSHRGTVAVAVKHLKTGENFAYRPDEPMPTASLIKFPIMATAYEYAEKKKINLSTLVELKETDKVPGSGILTIHFSAGSKFSVRDLIRLMIVYSDNTATNMVINQIGLPATSEFMARINLANTQLNAKVFRADTSIAPEDSKKFGLGNTTAAQTIQLYEMLHKQQLVSKAACAEMLGHLRLCEDKSKLARYLPASARIAHKGGSVTASRCDAGIIESPSGAIAVCVLTTGNSDKRWITDNAANRLCANIAKSAYDYFNPTTGVTQSPVVLKIGASGRLIEDLQRTLNARLKPSPELSIDGEFGGVTLKAIERFQTLNKLEASGVVDKTTWAALGTLQTQPTPVDDPTTINSQTTKRETADSLTGAPHVTCKAWAIADAQTGKLLWSNDENKQLNFASTTKIMTAFIVIKLAESKPSVLEETVTFSVRADKTGGSTAGIRAGEQLTVGELLYGLLLPSGNDASVALAEHFGRQFNDKKNKQKSSPMPTPAESYDMFIAKMNAMARSLGMSTTTYKNPHGLTAKGHLSSAADLLKLAYAAMQIPRFREYVNTPQHGCSLTSTSGYQRNVVWKNTNRLLGIEGYAGVKTGTTSAAGACLVSHATRGDDQLLLVVLGAQSSTARYVDSRNLYRWAWLQRGHKE